MKKPDSDSLPETRNYMNNENSANKHRILGISFFRFFASLMFISLCFAAGGCDDINDFVPDPVNDTGSNPDLSPGKADGYSDEDETENNSDENGMDTDTEDSVRELDWESIAARCPPPEADEPFLTQSHYAWNQTLDEMRERYVSIYNNPERSPGRAYWNSEAFVVPYNNQMVTLSKRLILNLTMHIEKALQLKYVDFIFFSDMGHNHFFIPMELWTEVYSQFPVSDRAGFYSALFEDPELKILYHTAEQLNMLDENRELHDDTHIQWRYYTRNIVGDNNMGGVLDIIHNFSRAMNTAHDLEGHRYYGAGFYFSANRNGCFPFRHNDETYYYDISFTWFPL